jgi:hypothetical protein
MTFSSQNDAPAKEGARPAFLSFRVKYERGRQPANQVEGEERRDADANQSDSHTRSFDEPTFNQ